MSNSMTTNLTYRDSGNHYGGECAVTTTKFTRSGDRVTLEISGPTGYVARATLSMDAETARAIAQALQLTADGLATVLTIQR